MPDVLSQLKTENLSFIVLSINDTNLKRLSEYFNNLGKPTLQYAVLDLSSIKTLESPAWFRDIRSALKQQNISLIGVRSPQLNLEVCKALKIPVINHDQKEAPLVQTHTNLYIDKPIRTGQQVFSKNGSLIVSGHVSSGAELAAKDDIHIYGSANGKFLAGINGNTQSRIYLSSGYPELISIAGITQHAENLSPITKACYFWISDGQLKQSNL